MVIQQVWQRVRASNKCIYASDYFNDSIHRVELSGSNAVIKWSVGRGPAGLTVSSDKNVMVVIQREHKLQQFTTHGTLLQTIQLQSDIEWLQGVIQLFSGQFVISLRGLTHHRVCLLDDKGAVVQSYGSTQGSERTKLYCPKGIAVDKHGNILVADNRLLVLDPSLTSVHEMSVSVDRRRKEPYSLWYDKSRGRLLISESYGKRVIIIDHLKDFTSLACVHLPA